MRHVTSLIDISTADVQEILRLATELKDRWKKGDRPSLLKGHVLTQIFEKPSLRTRLSFESAMDQLGGSGIFLNRKDAGLEGRESVADVARVIGGYSDVIVLRTFAQQLIDDFAKYSGKPVVNGLSDASHPCQALTDVFTIQEELGRLDGVRVTYVGDGNNVAVSLAEACGHLGMSFAIGAPDGYELKPEFVKAMKKKFPKLSIEQYVDPHAAVRGADVVYTDVWASMGQEDEKDARNKVFAEYQVNAKLMKSAGPKSKFMHCLPARRGLEVTDEVIDGPRSIAFPQAENRMHLAKGVFLWVMDRSLV
jgi:ornithine carbamoyltransferase